VVIATLTRTHPAMTTCFILDLNIALNYLPSTPLVDLDVELPSPFAYRFVSWASTSWSISTSPR